MSDYYQSIANNEHEMLQNMANNAITVENANIEARDAYDKKQKDLSDAITNLQGKLKTEGGKKEVVDGVPISEDDVAELVGGKATVNLMKNTYHAYSKNLSSAESALSGRAGLLANTTAPRGLVFNADNAGYRGVDEAVTKIQKTKIMGQSLLDGFKGSTSKDRVASNLKQAVTKATQTAQDAGKSAEEISKIGKEAGEAGKLGKIFEKIGPAVSIADGLSLANQDIQGLREGKGWDALGDNWEERASNITGLVGDTLSLFPPTEVLGGVVDVASGIFDWLGEKKDDDKNNAELQQKKDEQQNSTAPPPQSAVVHPSMSAIGMVSNISHPTTEMISGSGAF